VSLVHHIELQNFLNAPRGEVCVCLCGFRERLLYPRWPVYVRSRCWSCCHWQRVARATVTITTTIVASSSSAGDTFVIRFEQSLCQWLTCV